MKLRSKVVFFMVMLTAVLEASLWNSPYSAEETRSNTLFTVFTSPPKHLDPVRSYNANEWAFLGQIYEPPLQYNYLKRPYVLEPLTLTQMPQVEYLDENMSIIETEVKNPAYTRYRFTIREDIYYQPHPAFVKDAKGRLQYGTLTAEQLLTIDSVDALPQKRSRKLLAEDYVYAIKRMAVRQNHSPILDVMAQYIVGLGSFSQMITQIAKQKQQNGEKLDLRSYTIDGVKVLDNKTFEIIIRGKYPQ
ncbi:MAG: peptide ABC transporter substrate-binding protein, partial [Sulfurovum sp.]|nr:peptide ABC transporter substrate-binding protein [Sulfurovum sp.]